MKKFARDILICLTTEDPEPPSSVAMTVAIYTKSDLTDRLHGEVFSQMLMMEDAGLLEFVKSEEFPLRFKLSERGKAQRAELLEKYPKLHPYLIGAIEKVARVLSRRSRVREHI